MKKSTIKTIKMLEKYIGKKIIRTHPTIRGDWSYADTPILLVTITKCGRIVYKTTSDTKEDILPIDFTDRNWILYEDVFKTDKNNVLNKWKGKNIKRIRPTATCNDYSYMDDFDSPVLVSASKYHMVITKGKSKDKCVLRSDYMDPKDWKLA